MKNWINWFEIPVSDFSRAQNFYCGIFGIEMHVMEMMGMQMGIFPTEDNGSGGAIVKGDDYTAAMNGTLIYLNGGHDLNNVLNKIEAHGGKVFMPKTIIGEDMGYFAIFADTEGNKLALHSMK